MKKEMNIFCRFGTVWGFLVIKKIEEKYESEKKLIATGIATSMLLLALTGCGAGGNSGKSAKDTDKGSVYFLNFKSELSSEWEEVAGTFTKETGIDMKVVTAGSGTYEQTLKSELSKKEMPTLLTLTSDWISDMERLLC